MMRDFNEQLLQINYDSDANAVVMKWSGFSKNDEFREANEAVLDFIKQSRANKLLADTRDMKIISIKDQQWLYLNWLPRTIAAGLNFAAIIKSEDFFNRLSVDNVVQQVNDHLTVKYFNTFLRAKNWLKVIK